MKLFARNGAPSAEPRSSAGWRKWNVRLHREAGYLTAALTVIYAISGLAVNHVADWNPNYRFIREERTFEPVPIGERDEMVRTLVERLDLPGPPKESFRPEPGIVEMFWQGWSVRADAVKGTALIERPKDRPLLRDMNFLHLNQPKKLWTWFADAYALVLIFIAVSGSLIPRGRHGLSGRGGWILAVGIAIPLVFVIVLRYL